MASTDPVAAAHHGFTVNQNDGIYRRGIRYSIEKKLEVAAEYRRCEQAQNGALPNKADIARKCGVGRGFITKVENELLVHDGMIPPDQTQQEQVRSAGGHTIDNFDAFILMMLYLEEPSRSMQATWNTSFC